MKQALASRQLEDVAMGVIGTVLGGLKELAVSEYEQAKEANKKTEDYGKFVGIMDKATERGASCKPGELSKGCGISTTLPDYQQEPMTTTGPFGHVNHMG